MMSYINETDFVIENKELVYPEIVTDGLQLYYDAKGKRDTDYHRDTMLDMSGNKNHGKLHNFAYEKHSGYKDGLVFDYIDDKLVRPTLDLQPNDFTFMLNGNIISFSPDGTVKRVQDGEVIESKGFNLVRNGDFADDTYRWNMSYTTDTFQTIKGLAIIKAGNRYGGILQNLHSPSKMPSTGEKYYFCANIERASSGIQLYLNDGRGQTQADGPSIGFVSNTRILSDNPTALIIKLQDNNTSEWTESKISNMVVINLTEVFGTGNEPTKEQVDEIINRFGFIPNAQDLIDRIEYKGNDLGDMENIIDGLYKTEVLSGEEIYTDKADDDAVVHVEVDGKSAGGGSGKNIMQGYQTLDRMSEHADMNNLPRFKVEKNKKYQLSHQPVVGATKWRLWIKLWKDGVAVRESSTNLTKMRASGFYFNGNTNIYLNGGDWNTTHISLEFYDDYEVAVAISSGDTVLGNYAPNPQMELGEEKTDYEPPAPTPDYPIEIHSLNDFDVVSSKAINMFNSKDFIKNGIDNGLIETNTTLIEVDGYSGFQHKQIAYAEKYFNYLEGKFKGNTSYTLSFEYDFVGNNEIAQSGVGINYTTGNGEHKRFQGLSDSGKVSIKTDPERTVKNISIGGWAHGGSFKVWKISLIKTNDFKEHIPHVKDIAEDSNHPLIDKINLLLDEPLRSVGDVKDRLFRDVDGLWKIERKTTERIISGGMLSYRYRLGAQGINTFYNSNFPNAKTGYLTSVSSHFKNVRGGWDHHEHGIGYSDHTSTVNKYFYFPDSLTGISESDSAGIATQKVNNWLALNPVSVVYQLANPVMETLPQSLQDKLNNLRTFKDSNYIYTVLPDENNNISNNLKPTLHAKFLYNNWYKEDRVINNLMIYNRALTNEEMLQNYKTIKRRWRM